MTNNKIVMVGALVISVALLVATAVKYQSIRTTNVAPFSSTSSRPIPVPTLPRPSMSASAAPTPSNSPTASTTHSIAPGTIPPSGQPDPAIQKVITNDPVVFITIDDGFTKDADVLAMLQQLHVPVTPFLTVKALTKDANYFNSVQFATGQHVQNHTMTHARLTSLDLARQEQEICSGADQLATLYGTRPWIFRPPFGSYNNDTLIAATHCGMTTTVLWDVSLPNSIIRYGGEGQFHAGDILLIHWRRGLLQALPIALEAIAKAGLHVAALQDYLPAPVSNLVGSLPSPAPSVSHAFASSTPQ